MRLLLMLLMVQHAHKETMDLDRTQVPISNIYRNNPQSVCSQQADLGQVQGVSESSAVEEKPVLQKADSSNGCDIKRAAMEPVALFDSANFKLDIPDEKKQAIATIIETMGKNSAISLGFKKSYLESLGKDIKDVPAIQFLAYIFSTPKLKAYMPTIHNSSFKWNPLIKGLSKGLQKAYDDGILQGQLKGFAEFVHADYAKLEAKMKALDWEGFVIALMSPSS